MIPNRQMAAAAAVTISLTVLLPAYASAADALLVPVEENILLTDKTGQVYIHIQNEDALHVTIDKTEPEGIFRYYDADLSGVKGQTETVYRMDLSRCEYLVDSGAYASQYTISISAASDADAVYTLNLIVQDPDFEITEGCTYHFYVQLEESETSGYRLQSSQESMNGNVLEGRQILVLRHREHMFGDADGDGMVSISDASAVLQYYAGKSAGLEEEINEQIADIDKNGTVNIADATCILTYYAKTAAGIPVDWDGFIQ